MFGRKRWASVGEYLALSTKELGQEERVQVLELGQRIAESFEDVGYAYSAILDDEYWLEQRHIVRAFAQQPWTQLLDKPVRKNLSLFYSVDQTSFVRLLPALLVTGLIDLDTRDTAVWQLIPNANEFYMRMELLNTEQHAVVRQWLAWALSQPDTPDLPETDVERIAAFWQL